MNTNTNKLKLKRKKPQMHIKANKKMKKEVKIMSLQYFKL